MDGQKSEGALNHHYSVAASEQPDHYRARYLRPLPVQWMRWVVAVLCAHAAVVAALWGAVWHNIDEQNATMVIELVSSSAQAEGQAQDARVQLPPAQPQPAQRTESGEQDPVSSMDPAALAEPADTALSPVSQEKESAPDLAMASTSARAAPRPVSPRPVSPRPETPKAAPVAVKPTRPTEPAVRPASVMQSSQADALASRPAGSAPAAASAGAPAMTTDKSAWIVSSPKPPYPRSAYRARQEGRVTLDIEVLADGKVGRATLHATSGVASLDEAALEAIRSWQYAPGTTGGKLSAQWIRVVVAFELKNR